MAKLLIVEDDAVVGLQLVEALKSMGFNVAGRAMTGQEAVSMAEDLNPDLILMDIVLPGDMDGIEAAEVIKRKQGIPVIFITGHTEEKWVNRAKTVEPFGYIFKPLYDHQIKAAIEIALHRIQIETKLTESEVRFKQIAERSPFPISIVDSDEDLTLRQQMQDALKKEKNKLERMVEKRTEELKIKSLNLEDANEALKNIIKKREEDKNELEEKVLLNVRRMVLPYVEKLKNSHLDSTQQIYIEIIEISLKEIVSPFSHALSTRYINLTPKEVQIANLIKQGKSTKEISIIFNLSKRTIDAHRNHIRKKLGLKKKGGNLRTHLLTIR